jgi:ATP-dependent Clp endopeptidase proteolytic subunit ClpP
MTATNSTITAPVSLEDRLLLAEIGKLEGEAQVVETALRNIRDEWFWSRQASVHGGIGGKTAESVYRVFNKWDWIEGPLGVAQPMPFHLNINCPAGRYIDSFAMYDIINHFQQKGHDVTIQNTGLLCTQSLIAMQSAKRRTMTPRSWIILTEADGQVRGNTANIKDAVRFMRLQEEQGWGLLVERAKKSGGKLDLDMIKDKTYRGAQWHVSAEEALELGLIDDIVTSFQSFPGVALYEDLLPTESDSLKDRAKKAEARLFLLQADLQKIKFNDNRDAMTETGQISLFDAVRADTCDAVMSELNIQLRRGTKEVDLLINSPGGDVYSGCGLMDGLDVLQQNGAELTTTIYGMAASMGGFLAVTGKKRRISRNSFFMIHQVSTMFATSSTQMEENQESMERLQARMFEGMAATTGGKLPVEELKANCAHNDWWLTPDQALERGLVTEIV